MTQQEPPPPLLPAFLATQQLTFTNLLGALRPSILSRRKAATPRPLTRTSTSHLDGLRGFAALVVYFHHHQVWARVGVRPSPAAHYEDAFGQGGNHYFAALPGVRILFTGGHFAVAVFFVISGRVLVQKALMLLQAGETGPLVGHLASGMFRRPARLFLPALGTTFCYLTIWHLFGVFTPFPEQQESYAAEVRKWAGEFAIFSWVFRVGSGPKAWLSYNFHLWSIPTEFRGSIVLYTTVMAMAGRTRNARLAVLVALILYFILADACLYAMFVSGMLICDLELLATNDELPKFLLRLKPYKKAIAYGSFITSIYLGGVPSHNPVTDFTGLKNPDIKYLRDSPGWYLLSHLVPDSTPDFKSFFLFWAATFLVAAIPHIQWLKSFFELRFNQYLGQISYSLYLVHGPILMTLADRIYLAVGWLRTDDIIPLAPWLNVFPLSRAGPLGLELAFLLPHLLILPATLWCAEIATKLFDEPSIRFSHWLYSKTLASSGL